MATGFLLRLATDVGAGLAFAVTSVQILPAQTLSLRVPCCCGTFFVAMRATSRDKAARSVTVIGFGPFNSRCFPALSVLVCWTRALFQALANFMVSGHDFSVPAS